MGPIKTPVDISFARGIDTKNDPFRIPTGSFLSLTNMVFTKGMRLTKRNGYGNLTLLPEPATFITTFNDNLTATGQTLQAFSQSTNSWVDKGTLQPVNLSVLPLIRSNTNQSQVDSKVASNGLICTVYTDQVPSNPATLRYMYVVANSTTGQNIVPPTVIPGMGGTVTGSPRVFILGAYFIIVFTNVIAAVAHLQYIGVSISNPNFTLTNVDIAPDYNPSSRLSWDAVVFGNSLYFAYDTTSGGQSIQLRYLTSTLILSNIVTYSNAGKVTATIMSVTADQDRGIIYAAYYDSVSSEGYVLAIDNNLNKVIIVPVQIISATLVDNITGSAQNGVLTVFYEVHNNYSYDSSIPTHYISKINVSQAGSVGSPSIVARSVGLASKSFIALGDYYFLSAYQSPFQPTYFLLNSEGEVVSRIAYSNGGGYCNLGLPSVQVTGGAVQIPYLIKDFITSQNTSKDQSVTKSGIYSQTGINLVTFNLGTSDVVPAEIAQTLNISGGFLWEYDGYSPVEQNFFLWPDSVEGTPHNTGGAMVSQEYQYQVVYTWTNNQGNIERSAPSIATIVDMSSANLAFTPPTPITFTANLTANSVILSSVSSFTGIQVGQYLTDTTVGGNLQANSYIVSFDSGAGTITLNLPATTSAVGDTISTDSINSVTLNIPTLRLTYKTANPVKLEIFRWSTSQQEFFQVTSILQPLINNTTVDSVSYVDTQADNQILGNSLIYTTGGVIENIGAPSFTALTLFDDRLWGIDAEDQNLLWYSKQVIEATPVEMSDLFTFYVAPSTASQGSTGNMFCIAPMDDKLIILKQNALYYINGTGPDNTGANSQYSPPIFITSVVGSINQKSIVLMAEGLMFQSDKGIWILNRGMQIVYIGAPVEEFTKDALVQSAVSIPETTQVRFTLNSGITLMYDYYFQQWGIFKGVSAISSTLYQNKHTFLNKNGKVFQETPGLYIDGSNPVLMGFQTGWINLAGIQGYQRIYDFGLLGTYLSPHKLSVKVSYDFKSVFHQTIVTPNNFTGVYGSDSLYGQTTPYGGPSNIESNRIDTKVQKCSTFQITIDEMFDATFGVPAGAGFTMTGINCVIGTKKGYKPYSARNTFG